MTQSERRLMLTFHSTKKWRPSLFFQTLPTLTLCLPCLCSKLKPSGWFAMVFVCLFWLIYLWFSSESEEKCLDILRDERNCGCADKRPRGIFTFFSCVWHGKSLSRICIVAYSRGKIIKYSWMCFFSFHINNGYHHEFN